MTIPNVNAVAAYRRALGVRGEPVTFRRVSGQAPNAASFDATVTAVVRDYQPQAPVMTIKPEGAVTLGARSIIVMDADLSQARFPLPLKKNDKVLVRGQWLNVESVDPSTRGYAGAWEIRAEGI